MGGEILTEVNWLKAWRRLRKPTSLDVSNSTRDDVFAPLSFTYNIINKSPSSSMKCNQCREDRVRL